MGDVSFLGLLKTSISFYTLAMVSFGIAITVFLLSSQIGLLSLIKDVNPVYIYTTVFYITLMYACQYPTQGSLSWSRDHAFRSVIAYPISNVLAAILWYKIKGSSNQVDAMIVNLVGGQIFNVAANFFNTFYAYSNGPSDLMYKEHHNESGTLSARKIIILYFTWALVNLGVTVFLTISLVSVQLPIALAFLPLTELERILIFGLGFPLLKLIISLFSSLLITVVATTGMFNGNPQGMIDFQFTTTFSVGLFFSTAPLYSMILSSPIPGDFILSYIPHALFSKLPWLIEIPKVKLAIEYIKNKMMASVCCCFNKKLPVTVVIIVEEEHSLADDEKSKKEEEEEQSRREEEQKKMKELAIAAGNKATIQEAVDLIVHWIAIIAAVLKFQCYFFTLIDECTPLSSYTNFVIVVVLMILIDHITAIFGFMFMARQGVPLDANFNLDYNILNPIRTLRKGKYFKALGGLSFSLALILSVCSAIAVGSSSKIF